MQRFKTVLKFTLFPVIALVVIVLISMFMADSYTSDDARMRLYRNEAADSIDIAYVGASTIRAGIIPTEIYHATGLTGYDLSFASLPFELVRPILEEAQLTQKPKLYVIDINNLTYSDRSLATIKDFLKSVPDKARRNRYLNEIEPNKFEQFKFNNQLYANHENWRRTNDFFESKQLDINSQTSVLKGAGFYVKKAGFKESETIDADDYTAKTEPSENNLTSLDRLLDYIEANDLNVVFVKTPRFVNADSLKEIAIMNYVTEIINEHGFEVLNYARKMRELGMTPSDFADFSHLNVDGAKKFSNRLIEDILELGLVEPSAHTQSVTEHWDQCYLDTDAYITASINSKSALSVYNDLTYLLELKKRGNK